MAGFRLCVEPGFNIDTFVYLFLKFPFGVVLPFVVGLILHSQTSIQQPWPFISIFPSFYLVAKISQWVTAAPPLAKEIDWKSSVVVLTGGSHGVGYSLARQMLGHGATVVVLDIQPFRLHSPFHNLKNRIKYYRVDLGNKNDVKSVCKKVKEEVGQPNVLVCNAGTVSLKNLLDQTDDDIERVNNVNYLSNYILVREFLPGMLKNKNGHILFVSSVLAFFGCDKIVSYSASKAALHMLYNNLRQELLATYKDSNVQVSAVYPSFIDTGMFNGTKISYPFLFPVLKPELVANRIFEILHNGVGQQAFMPFTANLSPLYGMFPDFIRDLFNDYIITRDVFKNFTGYAHTMPIEDE